MKNIFLLLICCWFLIKNSNSQNAKLDSLLKVLEMAKEDTNKVNTLNNLSRELRGDKAKQYAKEALAISGKINFYNGKANAYNNLGVIYYFQSNYPDALKNHFAALKIREEIVDKMGIANSYNNIGVIYLDQDNYPEALKNLTAALKIRESLGDKKSIANSYINIGNVYGSQGNYPEALRSYFASLNIKEEIGDKKGIADSYINISIIYNNQGNYPEALKNCFVALKIQEEIGDKNVMASSYNNIGNVYSNQENYPEALKNYFASLKIKEEICDKKGIANSYINIGTIYEKQGNYTESLKNYFASLKIIEEIGDKRVIAASYNNIGNVYSDQGKYSEALKNYFASLKIKEEIGDKNGIISSCINIGTTKVSMQNVREGKYWLNKGLKHSEEIGSIENIKEAYSGLAAADSALKNYKGAYENHKQYIFYRDSLLNEENTKKSVEMQMQYKFDKIETATKAETDKKEALAKAEIGKQKIIRNSIAGGTGILVFSSIFSFMVYKRKREASFKNEVSEVEMKALRSQMNPHFIFNSLNSIKRYMANHDNKTAEDYLTKFANVMRLILENSEHKEVPLQQDLKALELYMQLESLRMKKKFIYEIKVDESIDQENTLIPPLILQPFVENSIWHGLAGKDGEGKISISINKVGEMIECTVEDNGVGRKKAEEAKGEYALVEKKSLGMKITNARIDILNKIKKSKAGVELVDLAEGMKVIVRLPLELSF